MNDKQAFVYMLASQKNGTLYTGVTSDLVKRIYEHKTKAHRDSFTAKYTVDKLVWYETGQDIAVAIELEKKIKNRNRAWKIALIEKSNPSWNDLSLDFLDVESLEQNHAARSRSRHAARSRSRHAARSRSRHAARSRSRHAARSRSRHAARSRSTGKNMDSATDARNDGVVV